MNKTAQFIIGTLVLVLGFMAGFALAEATVVTTVSNHTVQIAAEVDARKSEALLFSKDLSDDRVHYDTALTELLQHMDRVIDQNTALMAELKAQRRVDP